MKDEDIANKTIYDLEDEQFDELTPEQLQQIVDNTIRDKNGVIVMD